MIEYKKYMKKGSTAYMITSSNIKICVLKICFLVRVGMVKKHSHGTVPLMSSYVYAGMTESQVYNIFVAGQNVSVYCDMKTGQQISYSILH
jgi:hypothetical protein